MDWDALKKKYPEDADGIDKARRIHASVAEKVRKLDIPAGTDAGPASKGIIRALPYSLLADACRQAWIEVMGNEPGVDLETALKSFVADEPLPEVGKDDQDILPMFLRPAVTGYLRALREANVNSEESGQGGGECPFCSTYPRIAFDSEASRDLICLLCGMRWRFRRVKCPFCGNEDHNTLGYFDVEGSEGVRVQYCSECKHYLKVIDTRNRVAFDAETEDVLSLNLDAAAQEEGYL